MYARVSSEEQLKTGYSIPFQRDKCRALAGLKQLEVVRDFEESHSAKDIGRPVFDQMVAYLAERRDIEVVIAHKMDRFARNGADLYMVRDHLHRRVMAVDEPTEDNPQGRLMQNVSVSMAAYFSDNLSTEVKKGMRQKFEQGGCIGRVPFGYVNIPRTKTRPATVAVDEHKADIVRHMFARYAEANVSQQGLGLEMAKLGLTTSRGNPVSAERVRAMLTNPTYRGLAVYKKTSETRPGLHDAIIEPELFEKVQRLLEAREREPIAKGRQFYLLRGIAKCGTCGKPLTAESHGRKPSYYRCIPGHGERTLCPEPYVQVQELDQAIEAHLASVVIGPKLMRDVVDALDELGAKHALRREKSVRRVTLQLERAQDKVTRLGRHLADEVMTREDYVRERERAGREVDLARRELEDLEKPVDHQVAVAKAMVQQAASCRALYGLASSDAQRKALLRGVFKSITVRNKQIERIEYQFPFSVLVDDTTTQGNLSKKKGRTELAERLLKAA